MPTDKLGSIPGCVMWFVSSKQLCCVTYGLVVFCVSVSLINVLSCVFIGEAPAFYWLQVRKVLPIICVCDSICSQKNINPLGGKRSCGYLPENAKVEHFGFGKSTDLLPALIKSIPHQWFMFLLTTFIFVTAFSQIIFPLKHKYLSFN